VEPTLLATYETERRPAAERVITQSRAQLALSSDRGLKSPRCANSSPNWSPNPANARRLSDLLSGAENRYVTSADAHPLVGRWVPDFAVTNASGTRRVAELARAGRPLLVELTDRGEVAAALVDKEDRITVAAGRPVGDVPPRRSSYVPMDMWPGHLRCTGLIRTNCANCVAFSRIGLGFSRCNHCRTKPTYETNYPVPTTVTPPRPVVAQP